MKPLSVKAAIYLRAAELVEMGHCKKSLAKKADGRDCWDDDPEATQWCTVGAIARAER
jgi:hypothetical protein